ncbi:MAG: hypothetical protein RR855_07565 [Comamonas sp.]
MANNEQSASIVGLAWFREEEFDEIKRAMADGDTAFTTYADWLEAARRSEHHQLRAGHRLVRATIRPKAFKAWCKSRDLALDAASRKLFANWYAQEAVAKGE